MKIGVLTSSRADYGIYRPLLKRLEADSYFGLELIVFGTHLSHFYGNTVQHIIDDGFTIAHKIESLVTGDSPEAIAAAMGLTTVKFSSLWAEVKQEYDLIFCLGDRYEMFAAVSAGVPFNLRFAHIHGGEKTQGAIDNIFRHSITQMAEYHFTTTERYKKRVLELLGNSRNSARKVVNVGSLSLGNLQDIELLDKKAFLDAYGIDLSEPTILFTFHPETVGPETNAGDIKEVVKALKKLTSRYQIVITMPNSDTSGNVIRRELLDFANQLQHKVFTIESFGTKGYFSCMKYASLMMGNSSSGIMEAASTGTYVINLGDRQKGRAAGDNVIHTAIDKSKILSTVKKVEKKAPFDGENIYWNGGAADQIINYLKNDFK